MAGMVVKGARQTRDLTNTGTAGRGTNDAGDVAGWYLDRSSVEHGFLQPKSGKAVTSAKNRPTAAARAPQLPVLHRTVPHLSLTTP